MQHEPSACRMCAIALGDKDAPFSVSTQPDLYTSFFFSAPWTGMQYARSMTTALDNTVIIHHYLLFKEDTVTPDGTVAPPMPHIDGQLLQGWAPGGDDLYYSPDLGQEIPPVTYLLETHHNNTTGAAAPDRSGDCKYNAPANFGEGTGDEMCYYFTLYYPKPALTDVGIGSVVHGANQCGVSLF